MMDIDRIIILMQFFKLNNGLFAVHNKMKKIKYMISSTTGQSNS